MNSDNQPKPIRNSRVWRDLRRLPVDVWHNLRGRKEVTIGLALVMAAGVTLHWLAVGLEKCIDGFLDGHLPDAKLLAFAAISAVSALVFALAAWGFRHAFKELEVRYRIHSADGPRPFLVLFVSTQTLLTQPDQVAEDGPLTVTNGKNTVTLNRQSLLDDADELDRKLWWNWEMMLRALAPHVKKLRRVYLVGSADAQTAKGAQRGSAHDLETLRRLLAPYLVAAGKAAAFSGAANLIKPWPKPVNFEDFKEVHETLEEIRDLLDQEEVEDHELCVDITGGQKPTSAAAGTFTLNKDVVLQYVQTNPPKAPQIHDVRLLSVPEPSH